MSKTILIFSKFSPDARLQNELRQIQSGSISDKRMARLCHQFKKHDNFFTPEKIDNLIEKAQGFKGRMRVTLREISQFMGLCNSSKPAVLQAPLHYRSIQRLLIRNLRRFLSPCQPDYLTLVTLDTHSIQDLDWWVQEMRFNCTRKICIPQPNKF